MPAPRRTPPRPRGRPRDEERTTRRRDDIVRCAVRHFAESGYRGTDLEQVAHELGCAKGTLYRYFPTKQDLFAAATRLVIVELLERVEIEAPDPIEGLRRGIRAFLSFFDEHPEYVALIVQERTELKDARASTYFSYRRAHAAKWRRRFARMMDEGVIRRMPPDRPFTVVGDLLYGAVLTAYFAGDTRPLIERADDLIDIALHGLLTPTRLGGGSGSSGHRGRVAAGRSSRGRQ